MAFDGLVIASLAHELKAGLVGGRIIKSINRKAMSLY